MSNKPMYAVRTIVCANCGKTSTKRRPANRKYCCSECAATAKKPQRKTGTLVNCEFCGDGFYLPKNRLKRAKHFFCCLEHQIEWQGRNKVEITCKICGKVVRLSPSFGDAVYCSLECRDKDPQRTAMLRKMNIDQQHLKPNNLETRGYAILQKIGVHFEPQTMIANKFCVDVFVPECRLIIQFDGDYWHGNPDKFPTPDKRQTRRMNIDRSQNSYFKKAGYNLLRFWEIDINKRPEWVQEQIIQTIQSLAL